MSRPHRLPFPTRGFGPRPMLLLVALAFFAGCGGSPPAPELPAPPEPAIDSLEPAVAEALASARQEVLADPRRASAWGGYGQTLHAHDLRREAAECYATARRLAPAEARWPYLEGRALQPLDLDAALDAYDRAAAVGTSDSAIRLAWGDALLEAGGPAQARRQYERALADGGNDAFAHFGIARTRLLDGDLAAAREEAERAIALEPTLRNAHTLLAQIAQRQGDGATAQRHQWRAANLESSPAPEDRYYDQVVERGVSTIWHRRRGLAALRAGRFEEAETALRQVLAIQGDSAADHAHLGAALARQNRLAEPDSPTLHNNLAQALMQEGDLAAAEEHLEAALVVAPNDLEARLNAGILLGRQGRLATAREHLETALATAPGDLRVLAHLAPTRAALGEAEGAITLWTRLLQLAPDRLEALEQLGQFLASQGRHGEAIEWLRRGLAQAPNSSRLSLFLAWELATAADPALRNGAEARRLAQRVRDAYPQMAQAADVLAAALAETGEFTAAVETAETAITLARGQGQPTAALEARRALYLTERPFRGPAR